MGKDDLPDALVERAAHHLTRVNTEPNPPTLPRHRRLPRTCGTATYDGDPRRLTSRGAGASIRRLSVSTRSWWALYGGGSGK